MDTDDDEKETKHKPDLNFGVPKNIKKKPILIPAKGEYKFKGSANNKILIMWHSPGYSVLHIAMGITASQGGNHLIDKLL